ncbi:MAG: Alkanal monooxygenase alpha chain [Acidimicrobiales bacterium]|nr:MAG: LLM class flavin-dependent oxidoreductase [Actinomycetota bacterium]MBV6509102.1 Alkanal monooxygenase alpha chain [Acidimicrobiales bacterium]RIK03701.1 MAG: LLM class flavin-dependent oxidoreductase [Acidobacteriota bacterium]
MRAGILAIFQNYMGRRDDSDVVAGEMHLAEVAEEVGFDTFWAVEHHFTDYSSCPDNMQFLSWVAGRTERIRLGTGAVIIPWNNPLRVAEKISLLDHLSGGRAVLGIGRGLSQVEYDHFGIDISTSRDRFDEAATMILAALESGEIEGQGPYYPQVKTPIRPRPVTQWRDRFYSVGMSPESLEQVAKLGARLMIFSQKPWESWAEEEYATYRRLFEEYQGRAAFPPVLGDLMFCHHDPEVAAAKAKEYMADYFLTIVNHYELMSDRFEKIRGYEMYATAAQLFQEAGVEVALETYWDVQTWGTPEMILERLKRRRDLLGEFELNLISNYGGMTLDEAESSIRLFAEEVLPELHSW